MQAMEALGVPKAHRRVRDSDRLHVQPRRDDALSRDGVSVHCPAANVPMTLGQQITMMLTLMVTSKGVARCRRASIVILAGAVTQFNLPIEGSP